MENILPPLTEGPRNTMATPMHMREKLKAKMANRNIKRCTTKNQRNFNGPKTHQRCQLIHAKCRRMQAHANRSNVSYPEPPQNESLKKGEKLISDRLWNNLSAAENGRELR